MLTKNTFIDKNDYLNNLGLRVKAEAIQQVCFNLSKMRELDDLYLESSDDSSDTNQWVRAKFRCNWISFETGEFRLFFLTDKEIEDLTEIYIKTYNQIVKDFKGNQPKHKTLTKFEPDTSGNWGLDIKGGKE